MFRLLRYFSIASAVAVVAVTVVLVWLFRTSLVNEVVAQAEMQNISLARSIANVIWPRFGSYVTTMAGMDGETLRARPETREIDGALDDLTRDLPVVKVNIFSIDGTVVYSTEAEVIGPDGHTGGGFDAAVERRATTSRLIGRAPSFEDGDAEGQSGRGLVSTYLPVIGSGDRVEGVFEIYSDVTPVLERVERETTSLFFGLLLVFTALYAALFFIVRRADRILIHQYREIETSQAHLAHQNDELAREVAERAQVEAELRRIRDELEMEVAERTVHVQREMAERRVTESVLRESGQRFRDFEEAGYDWYWEMDADFRFSYVSDRYFEYTGLHAVELMGRTWEELVAAHGSDMDRRDNEKWQVHDRDVTERRPFRNLTQYWVRPDGEIRVFLINGRPVFDRDGTFLGYRGTGTDITELKRAEVALRESEARLRSILNNASAAIHIKDKEGRYLFVNHQFEAMFGVRNDDLHGRAQAEVRIPRMPVTFITADRKALDTGEPLDLEEMILQPDGEHSYLTTRFVLKDGDGATYAMCGMSTDITERKRMEARLRDSQDRYALAIRGANDAIWDWDMRVDRTYASPRLAAILGYREDEFTHSRGDWLARIHPENLEKYSYWLDRHLRGESDTFACEYQVRNRHGEYVWILDRGVALRNADGQVYRMAGSIGDITARRLAEDRLRQSQKIQALGQLAGGIAHEFNNLLVGIGGFANMAIDGIDDKARVSLCLNEVVKASDRAAKLTGDLLAFSRKQVSKPTIIETRLTDIVEDVANLLRTVVGRNVRMEIMVEDGDIPVLVDPSQISQVITNLAINGRDAMPEGGVLTVGTRVGMVTGVLAARNPAVQPGPWGCIYVRDTGTGIDQETLKRLFEPFFTTKDPGKGTGLGLAMVYGIVEQCGGFVDVDSELGRGSTFSVFLPLAEGAVATPAPGLLAGVTEVVRVPAVTVLVAEDDPAVRAVICNALVNQGHKVLEASDGRKAVAVAMAHEGPLELLLADIVMPELGGAEVARELLDRKPGVKIVFMSAYPDGERVLDEDWNGAATFIQKPFTPSALSEVLRDLLYGDA